MKRNWKRLLSSVLALVMVLAMLPVSALADGSATTDVKTGYYGDDGTWTEGTLSQTLPTGVTSVNKTAKKTADNTYEVTLEVQMQETSTTTAPGSAATVLAIDCSGSMAYCATCGNTERWCTCKNNEKYEYVKVTEKLSTRKNYYVLVNNKYVQVEYCDGYHTLAENHTAGWYDVTISNFEHKGATRYTNEGTGRVDFYEYKSTSGKAFVSRIKTARDAAIEFLQSYSGFMNNDFDDDGKVKTGTKDLKYGRYVAVVLFESNVSSTTAWYDVSTVSGYNAVYSEITKMNASGGTNLDAALTKAKTLLGQNTVKDCTKSVIALTDGQPTYYLGKNGQEVRSNGDSCSEDTFKKTITAATNVKNVPATLYTICFATDDEKMNDYSRDGYWDKRYYVYYKITLANYLSTKIATEGRAYQADQADDVATAFKAISSSITSGLSAGTVTDSLPTGVTEVVAQGGTGTFAGTWTLTADNARKSTTGTTTTYTWTKTYTVEIDPETATVDSNGYTPLNGATTLTVGTGNDQKTVKFPIPAGKVTTFGTATVTFEVVNGTWSDESTNEKTVTVNLKDGKGNLTETQIPTGMKANTGFGSGSWGANAPSTSTTISGEDIYTYTFTANQYTVKYDLAGGVSTSNADDEQYAMNASVTVAADPTKTGAVFAGWEITTNSTGVAAPKITDGKFTMPAANVTLTAKWTNTYTLTYANGDGENPANVVFPTPNPKTGIISGTSETLGTASTSDTTKGAVVGTWEFEGWYKEAALTNRAGTPVTVTSDTTVYAKWKFTPTQYTLSYENDGGTIASTADYTKAGSVANGTSIDTPTSSEITKTGFNFGGWYTDKDLTKAAATDLKMPTSDLTLYAKWIPAGNTAYTVEHYRENLNADTYYKVAADTENLTGTTGETAYATPKNYTGFTYDSSVEGTVASGEITADGTLVLKLFYKRDSYAVTYQYTNAPADATLPTESSQEYGASVTVKDATVVNGYTFNGWTVQQPSGVTITTGADGKRTFTMPAEVVVLTGSYSANSGIEYKIEYYFENLEGTEFEKDNAETVTKTGETDQNVKIQEADKKTFDGFTLDSANINNVLKGNITADGELILKLYYTRNSYKVTYSYTGTVPTGASTLPTEQTYKYGAAVTVAAEATADGYSFNGWNPTPSVTISDKQFTMPASAVTLTGSFELIPVPGLTVEKKLTGVNNKTYENYTGKVEVGDKLTWTITVTNTGDTTLSNIVVTDQFNGKGTLNAPDFVDGKFVIASLESGKSVSTQVTYTVLKSDANTTITNTAYAVILNNDGNVDPNAPSDNDTSEVEVKKIEEKVEGDADLRVEKTVSDKNPKVGDTITYTIVVTNTGEADLWNVRISDDFDGNGELDFSEKIPYLGEGMSKEFTYTYKVVEADRGEKLTNRVTVRGETDGGQTPSDTDKVVVTVDSTQTPANAIIRPSLNARDHVAYIIGYVDGTVRPENDITRSEVAAIFFRLLTDDSRALYWSQYNSYSDVSADAWYNNAVSTLSNAGIITGYTDGTFRPDQPITRAEFAAISARFSDVVYGGTATFPDVPATYWAYKYISLAQYLGWVQGMPDGNFYPAKNITRAEAITMINRVLDRDVEKDHMLGNMVTWTDNTPDKWYYEAVQEATNSHLYSRSYIYATGQDFFTEIWRSITENPDWAALEKAWSTANSK